MLIKLDEEEIIEAIARYIESEVGKEFGNIKFEDCGGVCIGHLSAECFIKGEE